MEQGARGGGRMNIRCRWEAHKERESERDLEQERERERERERAQGTRKKRLTEEENMSVFVRMLGSRYVGSAK